VRRIRDELSLALEGTADRPEGTAGHEQRGKGAKQDPDRRRQHELPHQA